MISFYVIDIIVVGFANIFLNNVVIYIINLNLYLSEMCVIVKARHVRVHSFDFVF